MYDVHTHFIPDEVISWLRDNQVRVNAKWEKKDPAKAEFLTVNGKWSFELKDTFVQENLYISEQQRAGVIQSLISPIPQLFLYEFSSDMTEELSKVYNDALADMSRRHDSVYALASLPLNDPALAADELNRAMSAGLKGAIIGPGISDKLLTHPDFIPLWEEAHRLGAILFIHPLLCEDPRLKNRMMPNLIGVPWETTVCSADILLSGWLDKYSNAKVLLAHGGGFLPYQIGRLNKGSEQWKAVSSALQAPPVEYLKRFWFDTVLWNTDALQYLIDLAGEEQVVPGSDFPFDLCAWPPQFEGAAGFQRLIGG